jgi:hypothetical protein
MLVLLVLLAGCRPGRGGATGASSPEAAVQQFLFASKASDLQAMSAVWGDQESPTRDRVSRQELERRLLIIECHLRADESRIGPSEAGEAGRVLYRVSLTKGDLQASPLFTTVRNLKDGRWYVENIDLSVLQKFCSASMPQKPPAQPPRDGAAAH